MKQETIQSVESLLSHVIICRKMLQKIATLCGDDNMEIRKNPEWIFRADKNLGGAIESIQSFIGFAVMAEQDGGFKIDNLKALKFKSIGDNHADLMCNFCGKHTCDPGFVADMYIGGGDTYSFFMCSRKCIEDFLLNEGALQFVNIRLENAIKSQQTNYLCTTKSK